MNKIACVMCVLLVQTFSFAADPAATQPATITGSIGKPDADQAKVAAVVGRSGVLFIRSQDRWDEINKRIPDLTPDTPLPKIDFGKQAIVLFYCGNCRPADVLALGTSDLAAAPCLLNFVHRRDTSPELHVEALSTKFILAVVSDVPPLKVGVYSSPLAGEKPANLEFSAFLGGKEGGDIVDGLKAVIAPKSATIKPGEDILIDFDLHLADPGDAKPVEFAIPRSVFVWDAVYSEGYRNHAFFVTTPDGKTTLLRPAVKDFPKNIPHPVEITAKQPYHLPSDSSPLHPCISLINGLGLDTSAPGTYTITGLYEETGGAGGGADGKTPMWGGSIATNTVTVEVKK